MKCCTSWRLLTAAAVAAVALLAPTVRDQEKSESPAKAVQSASDDDEAFDRAVYLESFDFVWNKIDTVHWDPEVVGEQWDAARDKYRPKMEAANSKAEALEILNGLIAELGQSHFGIISSREYDAIQKQASRGGPGYSGITMRYLDEAFVVTEVAPDSPAAAAGVETGWQVVQATRNDDKTIAPDELISEVTDAVAHSVLRMDTGLSLAARAFAAGEIGDRLRIDFVDLDGQPVTSELELIAGPGKPAKFGNLPMMHVVSESKSLEGGIGYYRFNAFLDAPRLISDFQKVANEEHSPNGLVIDLRGNIGGLMHLTMGMCGWLVDERVPLGSMLMRGGKLDLNLNPRKPRYSRPVAVLIDECSISAAEVMSGGLKDLGAARIFGSKSAGLVLPSTVEKLPSGDGFQYAMSDYKTASGRVLELTGVVPDEEIRLTRESVRGGNDPVLSAAMAWITGQL